MSLSSGWTAASSPPAQQQGRGTEDRDGEQEGSSPSPSPLSTTPSPHFIYRVSVLRFWLKTFTQTFGSAQNFKRFVEPSLILNFTATASFVVENLG